MNYKLRVELMGNTNQIVEELFEKIPKNIAINEEKEFSQNGLSAKLHDFSPFESFGLSEILTITLTISTSISASLISDWIINKFSKNSISIKIEDEVQNFDKKELEEKLEIILKELKNRNSSKESKE